MDARKEKIIPWDWIEDRLRQPRHVSMWNNLADFMNTIQGAYRRNAWVEQPAYLECWLEKDALSGIFENVLNGYGVTLNVGRGYDGWDSVHKAAARFLDKSEKGKEVTVIYFGDFDPSGEDMLRSLRERISFFGCGPEIVKCALVLDDVERYNLPPDFTKVTDTRRDKFVAMYGDVAVELDALPIDVLQQRIVEEVEARMDLDALEMVRRRERQERQRLTRLCRKPR